VTWSVEYAVEFFQECTTIYCGLTVEAAPFLKVMPSNEILIYPRNIKNREFDSASRTQSPLGHVNVNLPVVRISLPWNKIVPEQSFMSLPPLMALWSSPKFLTSQSMVGDSDGKRLGSFDGKTEAFSDGERLGSFDDKTETSLDGERLGSFDI
jgi:hypothetical protein